MSVPKVAKSQEYVDSSSDEDTTTEHTKTRSESRNTNSSGSPTGSQSIDNSESEISNPTSGTELSSGKKRRSKDQLASDVPQKLSKIDSSVKSTSVLIPRSTQSRTRSYQPPPGYESAELSTSASRSETERMFSHSSDKEIWYITAPSSLPLNLMRSFDVQAAHRGQFIYEHDGKRYRMSSSPTDGEALLLPGGNDGTFSKIKGDIVYNFRLRELSDITSSAKGADMMTEDGGANPNINEPNLQETRFFATRTGSRIPPPNQPKGLLMRYQPYGNENAYHRPYRLHNPERDDHTHVSSIPKKKSNDLPSAIREHSHTESVKKSKHSKSMKNSKSFHAEGTTRNDHGITGNNEDAGDSSMGLRDSALSPISQEQKIKKKASR